MSVRGTLERMTQRCSFQIKLEQDKVGAAMLTSVRKASGVRLAASSGVPDATFRMAAVKTSGLGITCNVHLQMQLHVVKLTAIHLLFDCF
jgi:hypothetical protein